MNDEELNALTHEVDYEESRLIKALYEHLFDYPLGLLTAEEFMLEVDSVFRSIAEGESLDDQAREALTPAMVHIILAIDLRSLEESPDRDPTAVARRLVELSSEKDTPSFQSQRGVGYSGSLMARRMGWLLRGHEVLDAESVDAALLYDREGLHPFLHVVPGAAEKLRLPYLGSSQGHDYYAYLAP